MKIIEGCCTTVSEARVAIIVARFNKFINENLLSGSIDTLIRIGKIKNENITVIWVPGSYEIPLIAKNIAKKCIYNAIIVLGTVLRGSTIHFDLVSNVCNNNLSNLSIKYNIPILFGILTTESIEQSIERSGTKFGNKGSEVALSALEMIDVMRKLK